MMKVRLILSTSLSVAALCLGSALALAQPTAAAERVLKLGYDVYLGGLNIFYFDAKLEREGDRYVISGGGKTKGFVRLIWRSVLEGHWAIKRAPDQPGWPSYRVQAASLSRRRPHRSPASAWLFPTMFASIGGPFYSPMAL